MDIQLLTEAANLIGNQSLVDELNQLNNRLNATDAPVMIPLVGEFSSGKTSLINALTDSKALETATKPTTATIFEVHFGAASCYAEILNGNGEVSKVSDIASLKNDSLADATVVTVFDTSDRVSPYTILVDTPGISSPDPKHQQVLVDFIPQADALLLVIDINQQLTKSLSDFLKSASLSDIEINVVLTKSDTKSETEVAAAKQYFIENCSFPINKIVAVSAAKENLDEIYSLFKSIESRKSEIVKKSVNHRLRSIAEQLLSTISTLLNATEDNSSLEEEIKQQKLKLANIEHRIDRLITNIGDDIEELSRECSRKFEDQVSSRLSSIINGKSQNYDAEAVNAINSIASILIGDYRQKIVRVLSKNVDSTPDNGELPLSTLTGIDLSDIGIQGLSYNLDLNSMGHEYDSWIKRGVIVAGALAAVGTIAAAGGGAVAAAEGAMAIDTIADVADTVTDVSSMMSNKKMTRRLESVVKYGQKTAEQYSAIDNINNSGVNNSDLGKGMLDSLAGFISEKTMSKPQRARAIRVYIDDSLSPEFKNQLNQAENQILSTVKSVLQDGARETIDCVTSQLLKLQEDMRTNKATIQNEKTALREMQTKLLTL